MALAHVRKHYFLHRRKDCISNRSGIPSTVCSRSVRQCLKSSQFEMYVKTIVVMPPPPQRTSNEGRVLFLNDKQLPLFCYGGKHNGAHTSIGE